MTARDTDDTGSGARRRTPVQRGLIAVWLTIAVLVVLGLVATGVVLYARGGGAVPDQLAFLRPHTDSPLEDSGPAEVVLRTLRLAGYQRAVVGEANGLVVVRVEVPEVSDPADVGLTWQTCMAAAYTAYPGSMRIVVQVFSPNQPLVEVSAETVDVKRAVETGDSDALEIRAAVRYLPEAGDG